MIMDHADGVKLCEGDYGSAPPVLFQFSKGFCGVAESLECSEINLRVNTRKVSQSTHCSQSSP